MWRRLALAVIWLTALAGVLALEDGDLSDFTIFGGLAVTVAAGAAIGRRWIFGIPFLFWLAGSVATLVSSAPSDDTDFGVIFFQALVCGGLTAALGIGMALRAVFYDGRLHPEGCARRGCCSCLKAAARPQTYS